MLKSITEDGKIELEIRDVHMGSTETTMDRYGKDPLIDVDVDVAVDATVGAEPNTTFLMDPSKQRELVIAGVKITIAEVMPYSITYTLENLNDDRE
jgi:hypothetical protein